MLSANEREVERNVIGLQRVFWVIGQMFYDPQMLKLAQPIQNQNIPCPGRIYKLSGTGYNKG